MHWMEFLNGLQFNDHGFFDQQIDAISRIEPDALVHDRQNDLSLHFKPMSRKLMNQTNFISTFEHTRPEFFVNVDRKLNYLARNMIQFIA
jgi:hypothetical protein